MGRKGLGAQVVARLGRLARRLPPSRALRAARAAARRKDWAAAADGYRGHLDKAPGDAPVWVQYGHALKEAQRFADAEQAYATAMQLDPDDPDTPVHLAYLLKQQGPARSRDAADRFAAIALSRPTAETLEAVFCGGNGVDIAALVAARPEDLPADAIFIELRDLFQYLAAHTTVTGIIRVTLGLVNHVLHEMEAEAATRYRFVHQYGEGIGVMLIDKDRMRRIVSAAMHGLPDLAAMQGLIGEIRRTAPVFRLAPGDAYLIVGAFWEFAANPSWLAGMRMRGVRVGCYIYDLIPVTHTRYCEPTLADAFRLAVAETARTLSFAMTISAFVATEVAEYLAKHAIPPFPVEPVLLAHELRFQDRSVKAPPRRAVETLPRPLADVRFVLCVCTIETRKNHRYLVAIWQRMIEAGLDVPHLVFVGRRDWRSEELMRDIEATRQLGGRLHILDGLSDDTLAALYDRCLFTAFPSFVEGWGLPVGESLAHHKVCVASSASSVPEVGGAHAIYVDPFDLEDGYATISDLVRHPDRIAALEARLRATFRPRTWSDVGRDFFAAAERLLAAPAPGALFAPRLAAGHRLAIDRIDAIAARDDYVDNPARLAFASGWRRIEAGGAWMLDQTAILRVQTDCGPDRAVSILLEAHTSRWVDAGNILTVSADGEGGGAPGHRQPLAADTELRLTLPGRTDAAGLLTVRLAIGGAIRTDAGPHQPLALRLLAFGYAPRDDRQAQAALRA